METISNIIREYNWESPFTFIIVILISMAFMRKWSIFLLVLITSLVGWLTQDFIIINMDTERQLVSLPVIVYGGGGLLFVILVLLSFYKS
ncbi:MAG: hypothetical protein JXB48_11910 [Candidatus Latescibacteria bacterium]|nr:hypothetical protein [Candidatus Latescibacterota bacterium]